MLIHMDLDILQKIKYLSILEKITEIMFCGLLIIIPFVFWKMKVYQAILYLLQIKKTGRGRQKRKKRLLFYVGIFILVFWSWSGPSTVVCAEEMENIPKAEIYPINNKSINKGIAYYDYGVEVKVSASEYALSDENKEKIKIVAVPQDAIAERSVHWSEYEDEEGNYFISGWQMEETEEQKEICFLFREDGKWKFRIQFGEEKETCSKVFVIDTKAPVLKVKYGDVSRIHGECENIENVNKVIKRNLKSVISSECEICTQKKGSIILEITENYFSPEDVRVEIYEIDYRKKSRKNMSPLYDERKKWEKIGEKYRLQFNFEEEGHYQIQVVFRDLAGWNVTGEGKEENVCIQEDVYKGPVYTVDRTKPVIEQIFYQEEPAQKVTDRSFFIRKPVMVIRVVEENFNQVDFSLQNKMCYADGKMVRPPVSEEYYNLKWTARYDEGQRINEAVLKVNQQANHLFSMLVTDGSGRKSDCREEELTYDDTPPVIEYRADRVQEGDILFPIKDICFFPYRSYRYFTRKQIHLSVTARDMVSGVRQIQCYFTDEKGNRIWSSVEKSENNKNDVMMEDLSTFCAEFMVDKKDFKGHFHVWAEDYGGLSCQEIQGKGMVSESEKLHEEVCNLEIFVPEATFTDENRKIKYFNHSVNVKVCGEDTYSGIKEIKISASERKDKKGESGNSVYKRTDYSRKEDVVYAGEKRITLEEKYFTESNGNNPVDLETTMTDNAGYVKKEKYEDYKIVIDGQKPKVVVEYDDSHSLNGKYYNRTRTALVTVKDWNFNSSAVEWQISGSNRKYHIGAWTDEGELHRCKVVFDSNGEDYKIKLKVTDYAGNQTLWNEDQAFTVDKTPPVIEWKMDRRDLKNEKYFALAKTLSITVKDRNIRREDIKIRIKAERDGEKLKISNYVSRKEKRTEPFCYDVMMNFQKDGNYAVSVRCRDLAGNDSAVIRIPKFTIDRTSPVIKVKGLENEMAYSGQIAPEIICSDRNLNEETFQAEIYRMDGAKMKELTCSRKQMQLKKRKEIQIKWEDFPHERWADGIYKLKISGEDYAGNQVLQKNSFLFYVNRFGSSYSMEKETEEILRREYLNKEKDLVLREISVTDTDVHISVWKDNQERKEGDYVITNVDTSRYTNGKRGWCEKEYHILKKNFAEEGVYQVTLYSMGYVCQHGKKKEIKETTNELQQVPICFTVDKTPPVVKISGLEDGFYRKKQHAMIITVLDNYALESVELKIHYERGGKKDVLYQFTDRDFGDTHSRELQLEDYDGIQTISYKAWDYAGNCIDSSQSGKNISCVISDKKMVQTFYKAYYNRQMIFKITGLIFVIAGIAGGSCFLLKTTGKKKTEEILGKL